jgi:protein-L-isoaspartate(D-aspartate) O-methyltransferase
VQYSNQTLRPDAIIAALIFASLTLLAVEAPAAETVTVEAIEVDEKMQNLIVEIERDTRVTQRYTGRDRLQERVLEAVRRVNRSLFVPEDSISYAWENRPLSIGYGQTISQPFIVALMTDLLDLQPSDRVLELGTGSGYQAAVLALLVAEVRTIEIVPELATSAAERLASLGYDNVHVRAGDGWHGWPEAAPFDAIIVTAVAETTPPKLLEQLTVGGRMVIPIGPEQGEQNLTVIEKTTDGITSRSVLAVRFVPLTRMDEPQ